MPAREANVVFKTFRDGSKKSLLLPRVQPGAVLPTRVKYLNAQETRRWVLGYGPLSLGCVLSGSIMKRSHPLPTWPSFTVPANSNAFMHTPESVTQDVAGFTDTGIAESANESWILVFNPNDPATVLQMLLNTMTLTVGDGGFGIYQAATTGVITTLVRGFTVQTLANPAGWTSTQYLVVGLSMSSTQIIASVLGGESKTATGTRVLSSPAKNVALGNRYHAGSATASFKAGLLSYAPVSYTLAQLNAAMINCARVKIDQGIPVFIG